MGNKAEKRDIIMKTALNLFIINGFHGTPTSLIAKEAGVANGTLFNYFKTKDILINEIFLEVKSRQKKAMFKGCREGGNLKKNLNIIWGNLLKWGIENNKEVKFIESYNESYLIDNRTPEEMRKNYKILMKLIEDYLERKKLENINPMILIFNFIGAFSFTLKYFQMLKVKEIDKDISNASFERFCKGIELTDKD